MNNKKTKEQGRIRSIQHSGYGKRAYYFHADEDFREDWDWGKNTLGDLTEGNYIKSKITSGKLIT